MSQVLLFGRIKAPVPAGFEDFWKAYHPLRRVDKARARYEWVRLKPDDQRAALDAVPAHVAHWESNGTEPQHIPHPSRWLKWRRWEDELPGVSSNDASLIRMCGGGR